MALLFAKFSCRFANQVLYRRTTLVAWEPLQVETACSMLLAQSDSPHLEQGLMQECSEANESGQSAQADERMQKTAAVSPPRTGSAQIGEGHRTPWHASQPAA